MSKDKKPEFQFHDAVIDEIEGDRVFLKPVHCKDDDNEVCCEFSKAYLESKNYLVKPGVIITLVIEVAQKK
ncbi:hypothetical protein ACFLZK_01385 [Patescibacteria group bacterium]